LLPDWDAFQKSQYHQRSDNRGDSYERLLVVLDPGQRSRCFSPNGRLM
jgi:hypothetical protein